MYYTSTKTSGDSTTGSFFAGANDTSTKTSQNMTTGLLPNYLTVSGKTRQNDLDVTFLISIQPGISSKHSLNGAATGENRQQYLTFGDASWGSVKLGKDIGIYASDAILNDMTLLGVGSGAGNLAGGTTTLGRIGTGYMYADWKNQIAYTSPNFNGFSFTGGVSQGWNADNSTGRAGSQPAFEGKASYSFAGDVSGKVWVSGISQKAEGINSVAAADGYYAVSQSTHLIALVPAVVANAGTKATARAADIGVNVNFAGFGATAYYGEGKGTGTTIQFNGGFDDVGAKRKSTDWYAQGTYTLPGVGTKLGVSYGESELKMTADDSETGGHHVNSMLVVGAYHPLTKHLNLVAEYSDAKEKETGLDSAKAKTVSLGAILFF